MKPVAPGVLTAARIVLGAVFVYMGLVKVVDPVAFLKLVRAYGVVQAAPALNVIAALLPWFEVFCGIVLVVGFKVRAAALLQLLLLVGFTGMIAVRGIALGQADAVPWWTVRFDCGCGSGEVQVGLKLLENAGLILLAALVVLAPAPSRSGTAGAGD